jgi:hypothetical protein
MGTGASVDASGELKIWQAIQTGDPHALADALRESLDAPTAAMLVVDKFSDGQRRYGRRLREAVLAQDVEEVKRTISEAPEGTIDFFANIEGEAGGGTALFIATSMDLRGIKRDAAIVSALLEAKANTAIPNGFMMTPLHMALRTCDYEVAALLVVHGANCTCLSGDGWTPYMLCGRDEEFGSGKFAFFNVMTWEDIVATIRAEAPEPADDP